MTPILVGPPRHHRLPPRSICSRWVHVYDPLAQPNMCGKTQPNMYGKTQTLTPTSTGTGTGQAG